MTNMNMFIALAVVCASIAASAPITVNQVTATVAGVSTSVGAIVLNDTMRYKLTAPFVMTMGDDDDSKMGFSGSVEAKTNDNPTCAGLKTITMDASFKLILPSDLTTPITTLKNLAILGQKPFPSDRRLAAGAFVLVRNGMSGEKCYFYVQKLYFW